MYLPLISTLLFCGVALSGKVPTEEYHGILQLDRNSFKTAINNKDKYTLLFVSTGGPEGQAACLKAEESFVTAALALKKTDLPVQLAKVDITKESASLAETYRLNFQPQFIIFKKGKEIGRFQGFRDAKYIETWVTKEVNTGEWMKKSQH